MRKAHHWTTNIQRAALLFVAIILFTATLAPVAQPAAQSDLDQEFQAAAKEFGVPADILKAISYNQSRWEDHDGQPSVSGGYGLMHLTLEKETPDGHGKEGKSTKQETPKALHTLTQAADVLGLPEETLKQDNKQNIRGAAALLAQYAVTDNGGSLPGDISGWQSAVARFGDMNTKESAQEFADVVFQTIQGGVSSVTSNDQRLSIKPQSFKHNNAGLDGLGLPHRPAHHDEGVECPYDLTCKWVPARFAQNDPDNPYNYGNYDLANREEDFDVRYIVIHTVEGSYQAAIDWYQDPRSYVSVQYTIRSSDGEVTQSVKNSDIGWQAGNWYMNTHSIGIEHEGYAAEGASWYTDAMYRSSAKLVRYLADKYDIPLDREHIIGHDQIPGINQARVPVMHWDPGPYWDWDYYMKLLYRPTVPTAGPFSDAVTIAPKFKKNKPPVTQCKQGSCEPLPEQSANFVYLRTEPDHNAPLINDSGLHEDGSPSTTRVEDWGAKATHGQRFAVAERRGDWTAVWFAGKKGWFYNPGWLFGKNALPARAKFITPKEGRESIPVYGRPVPEAEAYPDIENIPVVDPAPLQYTIPAGQKYVTYDPDTVNDYFLIWAFDRSGPGDGEIIVGDVAYVPITFNHRIAFVKADDVDFVK